MISINVVQKKAKAILMVAVISFITLGIILSDYITAITQYNRVKAEYSHALQAKLDNQLSYFEKLMSLNGRRIEYACNMNPSKIPLVLTEFYMAAPKHLKIKPKSIKFIASIRNNIAYNKYGITHMDAKLDPQKLENMDAKNQIFSLKEGDLYWIYRVIDKNKKNVGFLTARLDISSFIEIFSQEIGLQKKGSLYEIYELKNHAQQYQDIISLKLPYSKDDFKLGFEQQSIFDFYKGNTSDLKLKILLCMTLIMLGYFFYVRKIGNIEESYDNKIQTLNQRWNETSEKLNNQEEESRNHQFLEKQAYKSSAERTKIFNDLSLRYQKTLSEIAERLEFITNLFDESQPNTFDKETINSLCHIFLHQLNNLSKFVFEPKSYEQVDIVKCIDNALLIFTKEIHRDNIVINKNYTKNSSLIKSDRLILELIIYNVVRMSINRCTMRGMITFSIKEQQESILISITDNGYPFDEDKISSLTQISMTNSPFSLDIRAIEQMVKLMGGEIETMISTAADNTVILTIPKKRTNRNVLNQQNNIIKFMRKDA